MPRRAPEALVPRHIKLYESDWAFLLRHFGDGSASPMGPSEVIRGIVHQKVKWLRQASVDRLDELAPGEDASNAEVARILVETLGPEGATDVSSELSADDLGI